MISVNDHFLRNGAIDFLSRHYRLSMTDNCRKHGFRGKRAALLALLAALTISQFRTVKAQNELSAVQERDLDSILVVGLRTGTDDYEETYVDLSDGRFLIAPTKNDKPFHVMGFRQDEIEIKLKNCLLYTSPSPRDPE